MRNEAQLPNVQVYGQLLPIDALLRILARDKAMPGLKEADYYLTGEKLNDAINRSWNRMLSLWRNFQTVREKLSANEPGTSQTRENFLLPLFQELGYGRLSAAKAAERQIELSDGQVKSYAISHFRDESPIHLLGCNVPLDKKNPLFIGSAKQSPHSLLQEFLNRSPNHLWGFLSNGLNFRILRDSASLSGQACADFNLEGIFNAESFSEFSLLWLCAHQSRVHKDNEPPEKCWLEIWSQEAHKASVAALDRLRGNVRSAIEILGRGFIQANAPLAHKLAKGDLDIKTYFRQLLRLAYRLIFLFVVEERNLLHAPEVPDKTKKIYSQFWSLSRLRDIAGQMRGTKHHDLWEGIKLVMAALGDKEGCPLLGLAPLGGFLWSPAALPDLERLRLYNTDLLSAIRALAWTELGYESRPVDWSHLGALELGSIYESLLELLPQKSGKDFKLLAAFGNERKNTGSYYTPAPLIENLLDSALEPVLEKALASPNAEAALLNLKICDPACGSGHFLMAAAKRLAKRLAILRGGEAEPAPAALRSALREIINRCVYGIDINPMSLEICKLGFWLESHEPGKALSFLDHHLVCANSLLGTASSAIKEGIPASAYEALEGSDKKAVAALKKSARLQEKKLKRPQFQQFETEAQTLINAVKPLLLEDLPANSLEEMEWREKIWREWQNSPEWRKKKFLYDLWTAAFLLPAYFPDSGHKDSNGKPILEERPFGIGWMELLSFVSGKSLPRGLVEAVQKAAAKYRFFHMEVMFPEVAAKGGFDLILGNPPWERVKLQEKEWFSANGCPQIAGALNAAAREREIEALKEEDPVLYAKYRGSLKEYAAFSHFLHHSGLYPLCGRGDINLFAVFAEWMRNNLNSEGLLGAILPSGIATDDTTKLFFQDLMQKQSLKSLFDFENGNIFPSVHSSYKFCLLSCGPRDKALVGKADFVFFAHDTTDLKDENRRFSLNSSDLILLNPNTRTCPVFRSKKDALLARAVYKRHPVLIQEDADGKEISNPWDIKFSTMFHMANDSGLFKTREELEKEAWKLKGNVFVKDGKRFLPLYEAKMTQIYNHRSSDIIKSKTALSRQGQPKELTEEMLKDTHRFALPLYWVDEKEVSDQLDQVSCHKSWLLGVRKICSATNERTLIPTIFPKNAVGDNLPLFFSENSYFKFFINILSSFVCDFFTRAKVGGLALNFFIAKQLPVIHPSIFEQLTPWQPELTFADWLKPRILELTYTAEDMRPFAEDLGYYGAPFIWDEERRARLRAELDAAFFHLYLPANTDGSWQKSANETEEEYRELSEAFPTVRQAVDYIMESFPITRGKDEKKYGEYRTKRMILEAYDNFVGGKV